MVLTAWLGVVMGPPLRAPSLLSTGCSQGDGRVARTESGTNTVYLGGRSVTVITPLRRKPAGMVARTPSGTNTRYLGGRSVRVITPVHRKPAGMVGVPLSAALGML